jgi:hypothetical protein
MLVGAIGFLASALTYTYLLGFVRRVDRAFPSTNPVDSTWWFGYVRDLSNVFGMTAFSFSFWLAGTPGAVAALAGCVLALAIYGLDYVFARVVGFPSPRVALVTSACALGLAAVLLRGPIVRALSSLLATLFAR